MVVQHFQQSSGQIRDLGLMQPRHRKSQQQLLTIFLQIECLKVHNHPLQMFAGFESTSPQ